MLNILRFWTQTFLFYISLHHNLCTIDKNLSGLWELKIRHGRTIISASFEVIVTEEPHLVTDTVLPIQVEVKKCQPKTNQLSPLLRRRAVSKSFLTSSVLSLTLRRVTSLAFSLLTLPTCGWTLETPPGRTDQAWLSLLDLDSDLTLGEWGGALIFS